MKFVQVIFIIKLLAFVSGALSTCVIHNGQRVCGELDNGTLTMDESHNARIILTRASWLMLRNNSANVTIRGHYHELEQKLFYNTRALRLSFVNTELQLIPSGLFEKFVVPYLEFISNQIERFEPGCFHKIFFLQRLTISRNPPLRHVAFGLFSGLKIMYLNLTSNAISYIERDAFASMPFLVILLLDGNQLTQFDSNLIFGAQSTVKQLGLGSNDLSKVTAETLRKLPLLLTLNISSNQIRNIEVDGFASVPQLEVLDMGWNRIQKLLPAVFPAGGLQNLHVMKMGYNRITNLVHEVLDLVPNVTELCIGGNPWQCPCLKSITAKMSQRSATCAEDEPYFRGQRPSCFQIDEHSKCYEHDDDEIKNLVRHYVRELETYI